MKFKWILLLTWLVLSFTLLPETAAIAAEDHHHEYKHEEGHSHEHGHDIWDDHDEEEEQHGHTGEHGGQFGDASDMFHYEVLLNDTDEVLVYMYDGKAQRIEDITGMKVRWTLSPDSEYPLTGTLSLSGDQDHFVLDLPEISSEYVSIKIEAEKDGKWWPVEFLLETR